MGRYEWVNDPEDEDEDEDSQQPVKDLPAPARKHLRQLEKKNQELQKQLNELQASQRTANVADLVKAKGFNAKVAALVPSSVEATEEAVTKWLDEYKDLFAGEKKTEDQSNVDVGEELGGVPPEMMEALAQLSNASAGIVTPSRPADLAAQMNSAKSYEELRTILAGQGVQGL